MERFKAEDESLQDAVCDLSARQPMEGKESMTRHLVECWGQRGKSGKLRATLRASLIAQLVKNPPAIQGTPVLSPLEKGTPTHSNILAWRNPWYSPRGRKESDTT